jgi:hypothetical protein
MSSEYVSPPYEAGSVVKIWQKNPRFSHSDDPSILLDGSSGISDYVQGCIFAGAFCLALFIVWFVILAIFKCVNAGFLSGKRFTSYSGKAMMVRVTVMFCFLIVITMCILWPILGNDKVLNAFDTVKDSVNAMEDLSLKVIKLADDLIGIGESTIPVRDNLNQLIDAGICPGGPQDLDDAATGLRSALDVLGDFSQGALTNMRDSLEAAFVDQIDSVQDNLDKVEDYAGWTKYLSIPYAIFSFIFFVGAALAMRGSNAKVFFCIQQWFALPLWVLLLFLSSILCTIFGVIAVVNSDVCYANGSPASTFLKVVARSNLEAQYQKAVEYYIDGCKTANPFDDVISYLGQLEDVREQILSVFDLAYDPATIAFCGTTLTGFTTSVAEADGIFAQLLSKVTDGVKLTSCGSINPIYIVASHDALCTDLPNAVVTIFAMIIVVSIFGMIMLTCRAGSYPNIETPSEDNYPSKEIVEDEPRGQAQAY